MKKTLFSFLFAASLSLVGQVATNFTATDCASNNHDLFSELNSGKIVVLTWVMPCVNCVAGATSAQNAVNSFSVSNPGQVLHYIADDYANTTCSNVAAWCASNSISPSAIFSSTDVSMSPYGAAGMPKVIVLGANTHSVYYNMNGSANITTSAVQNAIGSALAAVGIRENASQISNASISPNPANNELLLNLNSLDHVSIEIFNLNGQKISVTDNNGQSQLKIKTESYSNGVYFMTISKPGSVVNLKFIVVHK